MKTRQDLNIFLFSSIAIGLALFLAFTNKNQAFEAKLTLALIPQNEAISENIVQIAGEVSKIPTTLSFYNKLIKSNEDVIDAAEALPEKKREAYWKNKIVASQKGEGGLVEIRVLDKNPRQAQTIVAQTGRNLTGEITRLYNIKNELSVEIVGEPAVKPSFSQNLYWSILKSLLLGLLAGFLVEEISKLFSSPKTFSPKKAYKPFNWEKLPDFSKRFRASKPEEKAVAEEKKAEVFKIPAQTETEKIVGSKKSFAPSNLPIADESALWQVKEKLYNSKEEEKVSEPVAEIQTEKDVFREATPEEVKERINKLLMGKL
ncbi:MAG TPA: hypothetical protein PLK35_02085 [Candidatus Moranbacteria bacterium]|nr:hypothetical protein [Candidatus Moranbacteria bacterium]